MKKLIIACEILILFIVLAKIAVVGGIIKNSETGVCFLTVNEAVADSPVEAVPVPQVRDVVCEDRLSGERKQLSLLLGRQKELSDREDFLKSEERRLNSLRGEILSKIDRLQEIEKRLATLLETVKEIDDQKYRSLAKIYESAPPARAGAMLEKLDSRTAAAIIMNMKSKKAGAIWGHIKPDKAVEITREITAQVHSSEP
ncbi:MAG: hypothetical protein JRC60_09425 [Deltaproteobacteria bacterium]|nr:hypothetical protein [Deltaproteobacteria bacterium]